MAICPLFSSNFYIAMIIYNMIKRTPVYCINIGPVISTPVNFDKNAAFISNATNNSFSQWYSIDRF